MATYLQSFFSDKHDTVTPELTAGNELLRGLLTVPGIGKDLMPELRLVPLSVNQVLYESGDKIESIYFPLDSIISGLAIMEDGTTMETTMVGREGLIGISSILGSGLSRQWMWATVGGNAIQLEARLLDRVFVHNEATLKLLLQFYRSLMTQVSQRCVCNTRHTILERLCCWLLMIHDRVGGSNLRLTQETIAARVGARRAGITVAAGMLQEMHAIEYRRGQLHIRDREILEQAVCECYAIMQADFKRLATNSQPTRSL